MRLFYVTGFAIFFWEEDGAAIAELAVLFRGGSGKSCVLMWCFCGESMVDRVVIVE